MMLLLWSRDCQHRHAMLLKNDALALMPACCLC
jgi:hypothetical protein